MPSEAFALTCWQESGLAHRRIVHGRRRTAEFLVSRAAHGGAPAPMPAMAAAAAGGPELQPGMAIVVGAPAVSPAARLANVDLVVRAASSHTSLSVQVSCLAIRCPPLYLLGAVIHR